MDDFDCVLVGGGLQSALIALALLQRPSGRAPRIAIVERDDVLGGNHTWSFHDTDVPLEARALVEPLVVARWPEWDVAFPGLRRTFHAGYASISSPRLHEVVARALEASGGALLTSSEAISVSESDVAILPASRPHRTVESRTVRGRMVVDARGPTRMSVACGYQKFVGLELELARPTERARPTLMDATLPQTDGFRFVYTLPLSPTRVLVEDTFFSDTSSLDQRASHEVLLDYAARMRLDVAGIARCERGVLPLPLVEPDVLTVRASGPLVAGYRGGFFHPTTGYSFPVALRVALHLAQNIDAPFGRAWERLLAAHAKQARFATLLNRLLFVATPPHHRRDVMARFHRLPQPTIARFYALETTFTDRARILCGRPPRGVSIGAALAQLVTAPAANGREAVPS